jgi:hypothetical protein
MSPNFMIADHNIILNLEAQRGALEWACLLLIIANLYLMVT